MKYKKKPVAVDAVQWTGDNIGELRELDGFTEVHARLGDGLIKQLREEGNWLGFTERLRNLFNNAAEAIEERDRHILTLQHEMMAEAESHTALVERLNKQIEELANVRPVVRGKWIEHNYDPEYLSCDFSCSECNVYLEEYYFGDGQWPGKTDHYFCPNCGADMREET